MAPPASGSASDPSIEGTLLDKGWVTREQLDECLHEQRRLAESGELLHLGQVLLKMGYLSVQQFLEVRDGSKPRPDSSSAERFGRYVVKRMIGRGGSGIVYEAEDPELKRTVALKVIREEESHSEVVARLHREAAIMAQLHHPNIVGVHEVGVVRDSSGRARHFIAMDYVSGRTMAEAWADSKVRRSEKTRMLEEVARAVAFAHSQGILHRDLKPANVLVEAGGRVLLTDFGLARADRFSTRLTRTAEVMGTPAYMAPEQVEGRTGDLDERTDVYALGAMLYEILVGRPPFTGKTAEKVYHEILVADPVRPTRVSREVKPELEVICLKALEKERARRYRSAVEFADDLSRFRRGEPILARPPNVSRRARKWLRQRKWIFSAAGIALLAVGMWAGGATLRKSSKIRGHLAKALEHQAHGRLEEAREEFQAVLLLAESHAEARGGWERASLELEVRRHTREEAMRLLETARPPLAQAIDCLYDKNATVEEMVRRAERSKEILDQVLAKAPDLAAAHYLMGLVWDLLGWMDRAEASLRKAVSLDPKLGPARYHLARILLTQASLKTIATSSEEEQEWHRLEMGHLVTEAVAVLEATMAEGSGFDDELQRDLAAALRDYSRNDFTTLGKHAEDGIARFQRRRGVEEFYSLLAATKKTNEERLALLDEAIRIRPKFGLALFNRGNTYRDMQLRDQAIADYTEAIRINPQFVAAYNCRWVAYTNKGDFEAALADFERILQLHPRYDVGFYNRGIVKDKKGDRDGAIADYSRAIEIRRDFPKAYFNRGRVYHDRGEIDLAIADYTQAIHLDPKYVKAHLERGRARADKGVLAVAFADYDRAIELDPKCDDAFYNRGIAYRRQGRLDDAIADYTKALEIEPRAEDAFCNRGKAHSYKWQKLVDDNRPREAAVELDAAISDYTQAIALRPDYANAYNDRGVAYEKKGALEAAIADYSASIRIDPKDPKRYHNRAAVYERMERLDLALADLTQAIALDPKQVQSYLLRALVREKTKDRAGAADDVRQAILLLGTEAPEAMEDLLRRLEKSP